MFSRESWTVGLISDTHKLLRPQAVDALQGSDFIIHAGDVGDPGILDALQRIAPVTAVRGNIDRADWASALPHTAVLELGGSAIHVIHDLAELDPVPAGARVVVSGHSHRPGMQERCGVLFINPGSAGPRRFRLPASLGRLLIRGDQVSAELIELETPESSARS